MGKIFIPQIYQCLRRGSAITSNKGLSNVHICLPVNDVVTMEIGYPRQQLFSVPPEHGLIQTTKPETFQKVCLIRGFVIYNFFFGYFGVYVPLTVTAVVQALMQIAKSNLLHFAIANQKTERGQPQATKTNFNIKPP